MFALRLEFPDGGSELLFLRRHRAVIGSGEHADVVLEGVDSGFRNIEIARLAGREFSLKTCPKAGGVGGAFTGQVCKNQASITWGGVTARIYALDCDLMASSASSIQIAEAQVLKQAISKPVPVYPAVLMESPQQFVCSFPPEFNLLIGRSRACSIRVQHPAVAVEHARIVYQNNMFWIEPLSETAPVYIAGNKVTELVKLPSMETVTLGSEVSVKCVKAPEELADILNQSSTLSSEELEKMRANQYPCIVSDSSFVRPGRTVVGSKRHFTVGRDPASDIWIGAAHISHNHLEIFFEEGQSVVLVDHSSNGTFHKSRRLPRGQKVRINDGSIVLDFQAGIELVFCFSYEAEQALLGFSVNEEPQVQENQPQGEPVEESRVFLSEPDDDLRQPYPKAATPGETHDFDPSHSEELMSLEEAHKVGKTQKLVLIGAILMLLSLFIGFALMLQQ